MVISYVDRQALAVLAPSVTASLHISEEGYGWLLSAFSIAYLLGAPIAGRWIDRFGARRGLLVAVLAWTFIAALHTRVTGFAALFVLRIALGFAESPSFPGAAQTIHRALPPADRPRGLGVLFTGSSIGAMVAPLLATALSAKYGFRGAFLGTALVGLTWVPLWLAVTSAAPTRALLDAREPTASAPWRSVLLHPAVLRATLVVMASAPAISFVLLWGAKFLVRAHGLTQSQVGHYLWLPPLLFDLGSVGFGDLASRRAAARGHDGRPDRVLLIAAMVLCTTVALMPFGATPWASVAIASVALLGGGGLYSLLTSDMLMRVPPGAVSMAGGLCAAAQSLVHIVAHPLIGRAVQATGSYAVPCALLGLWVIPGCVAWLVWPPPPPAGSPRAAA